MTKSLPNPPVFLSVVSSKLPDEPIEITGELHESFLTEEGALEHLKERMIEFHDGEGWVFKLVPVARVSWGKMKINHYDR